MNTKSSKKRKVTNRGLQLVNRAMKDPELAKEIVAIRAKIVGRHVSFHVSEL